VFVADATDPRWVGYVFHFAGWVAAIAYRMVAHVCSGDLPGELHRVTGDGTTECGLAVPEKEGVVSGETGRILAGDAPYPQAIYFSFDKSCYGTNLVGKRF
jgi:hypothetical protein